MTDRFEVTVNDDTTEKVAEVIVREQSSGMCDLGKVCELCDCSAKYDPRAIRDRDNYARAEARAILAALAPEPKTTA